MRCLKYETVTEGSMQGWGGETDFPKGFPDFAFVFGFGFGGFFCFVFYRDSNTIYKIKYMH